MVRPACIERVNNGILPLIEGEVGGRLVTLDDGGHKFLPATFDAVWKGINNLMHSSITYLRPHAFCIHTT